MYVPYTQNSIALGIKVVVVDFFLATQSWSAFFSHIVFK